MICACTYDTAKGVTDACAAHNQLVYAAVQAEREACWRIAADAYAEPDDSGHTPDWYGAAGHVMDAIFRRGKA